MKTQIQPLPDINKAKPLVDRLPILISARVRLDDSQRATLKEAVRKLEKEITPNGNPSLPGSTVSSSSNYDPFVNSIGLSRIVLADLLGTRESLSLITLINLQDALGVVVITEEDIIKAATNYAKYVFSYNDKRS